MRRYSIPSILFHWVMALAIAGAWIIGSLLEDMARGPAKVTATGAHALLGLTVAALLLPRLLARFLGGTPEVEGPEWERRMAAAVHLLLYALMIALPVTGLVGAMSGRAPTPVLGLFELPALIAVPGLHRTAEGIHGLLANVLLGAVGIHVAATLWHAVVRRDGVVSRMLPGGAR